LSRGGSFEIVDGVYYVGVKDWSRRLFDSLIPLPKGTSYNAYLVMGSEKVALIDTVNPGFERMLEDRIREVVDPRGIDYVVMNHAKPDHAGAVPYVLNIAPKAKLITTSVGLKMAKIFYGVPMERVHVVRDGDVIPLGLKTLKFIEAPMLHWPETMFTFLDEDGILFPCDFFGSHIAEGMFDDEVENIINHAQRYWAEIMMPFRSSALRALEKISKLDIKIIAPSHGPVYRNPKKILNKYFEWAQGKTTEKVSIIYTSMWGYTEKVVRLMENTFIEQGIHTVVHNLAYADLGDVAKDLTDSTALILATPTVIGFAHPLMTQVTYLAKLLKPPVKYVGLVIIYAWGTNADKQLGDTLRELGVEIVDVVKINVTPTGDDVRRVKELAVKISQKVKELGSSKSLI
jgi:flavorubredoxin